MTGNIFNGSVFELVSACNSISKVMQCLATKSISFMKKVNFCWHVMGKQ